MSKPHAALTEKEFPLPLKSTQFDHQTHDDPAQCEDSKYNSQYFEPIPRWAGAGRGSINPVVPSSFGTGVRAVVVSETSFEAVIGPRWELSFHNASGSGDGRKKVIKNLVLFQHKIVPPQFREGRVIRFSKK
jgi:hypothetical protein